MAEAYDAAIRRRLGLIGDMGSSATQYAQRLNSLQSPGNIGAPMRRPGNITPIGSGERGNLQALLAFGRMLEKRGYRVSENPHFGSGRVGRHTRGSRHYSGRAIDVNWGPGGTSRAEQAAIDKIVGLAKGYGLRTIWRAPGHYNHAHFDF